MWISKISTSIWLHDRLREVLLVSPLRKLPVRSNSVVWRLSQYQLQIETRKLDTARWYQRCLLVAFMCMRCEWRQFVSMWHGARCSHFGATALCWDCSTCLSASRCSSTSHKALRYGLECPHRLREVLLLTPCCKLASRSSSVVLRLSQSLRVSAKAHFMLASRPSWSVNFLGARGRGSILTSPSTQ